MHGSANTHTSFQGAPPPKIDFFLSRVQSTAKYQEVLQYITFHGITDFELTQVSNADSKFKSFKLSVDVRDKYKVMDPSVWPTGVAIEKWRSKMNSYNSHSYNNRRRF